jgi:hypothetical protein
VLTDVGPVVYPCPGPRRIVEPKIVKTQQKHLTGVDEMGKCHEL